jgi:PPOX class probable F420-dependent enzyme
VLVMAYAMTDEQARAFLAEGRRTGKLATTRADGRPHVAPVWFVLDGEHLVFMTGAGTVKGRTLRRDPRAALTVDLEEPPYAFVTVEGSVSISEDLEEMLPLSIAIARRYVPESQAEAFGRRNAVAGELLIRLRPDKIVAVGDLMG